MLGSYGKTRSVTTWTILSPHYLLKKDIPTFFKLHIPSRYLLGRTKDALKVFNDATLTQLIRIGRLVLAELDLPAQTRAISDD